MCSAINCKTSELILYTFYIANTEKLDTAPPMHIKEPNKKVIKPQNINERRTSLNVREVENVEAVKIIPESEITELIKPKSMREENMPNYINVDIRDEIDTLVEKPLGESRNPLNFENSNFKTIY